jgi:hypothetical protein
MEVTEQPWFVEAVFSFGELQRRVEGLPSWLAAEAESTGVALDLARRLLVELAEVNALELELDGDTSHAWRRLQEVTRDLRVALLALESQPKEAALRYRLDAVTGHFEQFLRALVFALRSAVEIMYAGERKRTGLRLLDEIADRLEARLHVRNLRETRDEAETVLRTTKRTAGQTGSVVLEEHFERFGRQERRTANTLRFLCVLVLLATTAAAVLIVRVTDDLSTGEQLAHLSFALPLALLAGYLGRESGRHRATANWARRLEVRLRTIEAYCEPLGEEAQRVLREAFGRHLFLTEPSSEREERDVESGPSAVTDLARVLEQIVALTKPGRGEAAAKAD